MYPNKDLARRESVLRIRIRLSNPDPLVRDSKNSKIDSYC
jgi:hypothetical protein